MYTPHYFRNDYIGTPHVKPTGADLSIIDIHRHKDMTDIFHKFQNDNRTIND